MKYSIALLAAFLLLFTGCSDSDTNSNDLEDTDLFFYLNTGSYTYPLSEESVFTKVKIKNSFVVTVNDRIKVFGSMAGKIETTEAYLTDEEYDSGITKFDCKATDIGNDTIIIYHNEKLIKLPFEISENKGIAKITVKTAEVTSNAPSEVEELIKTEVINEMVPIYRMRYNYNLETLYGGTFSGVFEDISGTFTLEDVDDKNSIATLYHDDTITALPLNNYTEDNDRLRIEQDFTDYYQEKYPEYTIEKVTSTSYVFLDD